MLKINFLKIFFKKYFKFLIFNKIFKIKKKYFYFILFINRSFKYILKLEKICLKLKKKKIFLFFFKKNKNKLKFIKNLNLNIFTKRGLLNKKKTIYKKIGKGLK